MTRPRAADDFAAIRARMEELQRERNQATGAQSRGPETPEQPVHRYRDHRQRIPERGLLPRISRRLTD